MDTDAVQEYVRALRVRYIKSTKRERTLILDEFCATSGRERKYAIKPVGGKAEVKTRNSGPPPTNDGPFVEHLVRLWRLMRRMCGKQMKAALPLWLNDWREGRWLQKNFKVEYPGSFELMNH